MEPLKQDRKKLQAYPSRGDQQTRAVFQIQQGLIDTTKPANAQFKLLKATTSETSVVKFIELQIELQRCTLGLISDYKVCAIFVTLLGASLIEKIQQRQGMLGQI